MQTKGFAEDFDNCVRLLSRAEWSSACNKCKLCQEKCRICRQETCKPQSMRRLQKQVVPNQIPILAGGGSTMWIRTQPAESSLKR
jgi:hypothetical protein